ncbi:hypothetical protein SAMN05720354_11546 [Nitrosospira sp. Nsp1]|nr:hypothetical protein SAMN05720354_11546 [Nitrosospira sp. Nsp1]
MIRSLAQLLHHPIAQFVMCITQQKAGCRLSPAHCSLNQTLQFNSIFFTLKQLLQFAALVHFANDIGTAHEFPIYVELRNGRPV